MGRRFQYQTIASPVRIGEFTSPAFASFELQDWRPEGFFAKGLDSDLGEPLFPTWFVQQPSFVARQQPLVQERMSTRGDLLGTPTAPIPEMDWSVQAPAFARLLPVPQQGLFTLVEFIAIPTFDGDDWPFLFRIDTSRWPSSAQYFFEAAIDTDGGAVAPVSAHLWNITDGVAVPGSVVSGDKVHADPVDPDTLVRSTSIMVSGNKLYRAERGGPTGSGAVVHMHEAKVIVVW